MGDSLCCISGPTPVISHNVYHQIDLLPIVMYYQGTQKIKQVLMLQVSAISITVISNFVIVSMLMK